ncbi:MAG: carbohydrate-binding domain-containing protein [Anaerolineales bacterium]|nr:carbohydrate-binding domain-containing protein [Anaerolineales bacterium]
MKKLLTSLAALLLAISLTACSITGAAPAVVTVGEAQTANVTTVTTGGTSAAAPAISASAALAENGTINEAATDYVIDEAAVVAIRLNGDSITASGAGVTVDGSRATITAPGTYRLSGTLADGQIVVDTAAQGVVQVILDGVDIHNSTSAAIYVADAEKVVILLADGSQNALSDGAAYVFADPAEDEPNAALFSTSDLTLAGAGALTVTGNYADGITSKDGLIIAGGSLTVTAADDGLRGKDYLVVEAGTLTVNAQGDGLKADNAEDATLGYIAIQSGTLTVTAGGDALDAATDVVITDGTLNLTAGGGSQGQIAADASAKGIKGTASVTIDGGTFLIDTADDALHSNGRLTINGGTFTIAAGDDGAHADAALTITGGDLTITRSYEGIESAVITLNGGTVRITASDDGLNVAGGVDGSGAQPRGMGGGAAAQDAFSYTGAYYLYVNGGYTVVTAGGDGVDVNGAVIMTDGVIIVNGPTEQMNGALDFDGGFNISGGFVAAAGSAGMAQAPGAASSQASVLIYFTATQPAGTLVEIANSAGQVVLSFTPTKDFQSLAFSSAELTAGASYTVYLGGTPADAGTDGLHATGTAPTGAEYTSFTLSGTSTTVGTGGMGGGGPRRP